MERKRVVITGVSAITPIGMTAHESLDDLLAGRSGISKITQFDTTGFDTDIAGEIKNFDPETYIPRKLSRHMDRFVQLSACASVQLMEDSGYRVTDENAERFGVILGVNMQTSFMHPPFGFALFFLRSVAPKAAYKDKITGKMMEPVTTGQIYWGAVPFVVIQCIMVALVVLFPKAVTATV